MQDNELLSGIVILAIICLSIYLLYRVLRNPFRYPYFTYSFDVSGKRNVQAEDYIDNFLRNEQNWRMLQFHQHKIEEWKKQTECYIQSCTLHNYRSQQYHSVVDDNHAYHFILTRNQTRYRQKNYVKTPYTATVIDYEWAVSWQWILNRHNQLEKIGFEATLRDYESKNQRRLMTPSLRKCIMERDHYTCKICGKHMPDEVGLHIDHIIPIARGGKSVASNLRVLCSKCNGSKGAR